VQEEQRCRRRRRRRESGWVEKFSHAEFIRSPLEKLEPQGTAKKIGHY
jgi:hypothetical protein